MLMEEEPFPRSCRTALFPQHSSRIKAAEKELLVSSCAPQQFNQLRFSPEFSFANSQGRSAVLQGQQPPPHEAKSQQDYSHT